MYGWYAPDPRMRANVGIRRRLAPLLDNSRAEIELIHALVLSLPGSPCLYYGDEIGMGDNIWLNDRDAVRTPMQWTPDRNSGFSSVDPGKLYLPVISSLVYHYNNINVEAQIASSSSLLHWLRGMLQIRSRHPVFGLGSFEVCPAENDTILAFLRTVDGSEFDDVEAETVLCVNNMSSRPQASVHPAAGPAQGGRGRGPLRRQRLPVGHGRGDADHHHRVAGLLLAAADPRAPAMTDAGRAVSSPSVMPLLPAWVEQQRWFVGRGRVPRLRRIGGLRHEDPAGRVGLETHLLLDESAAEPTLYQVPLSYREEPLPGGDDALVATIEDDTLGTLHVYDGPRDPAFAEVLLQSMLAETAVASSGDDGGTHAQGHRQPGSPDLTVRASRVLRGEQSNTSVIYDTTSSDGGAQPLICKIFRVLHHGENPDVVVQSALALGGSHLVPRPFGHVSGQWPDERLPGGLAIGHLGVRAGVPAGRRGRLARRRRGAGPGRGLQRPGARPRPRHGRGPRHPGRGAAHGRGHRRRPGRAAGQHAGAPRQRQQRGACPRRLRQGRA